MTIGNSIDVIVSLGNLITVPDFTNLAYVTSGGTKSSISTYNEVSADCTSSKLTCKISFETAVSPVVAGDVISQSQVAGTNISDSTVVEIKIAQ
jgi:beta-lactam-binding protein with PASTA domain